MNKKSSLRLNCFSPPVMIATVIVESCLAIYSIWRYRLNVLGRLIVACTVLLAVFQIGEYYVCTEAGVHSEDWSRIGYAAITTLPVLGLHILHVVAGKPKRRLVLLSYLTMVGYIAFFLLSKSVFSGYKCTGNYVIFQIGVKPALLYGAYYYGWIITALALGVRWTGKAAASGKLKGRSNLSVHGLIIGYLVFLIPTALVYSVSPSARRGIPSIMCGFAVLFALIITLYILPLSGLKRRK